MRPALTESATRSMSGQQDLDQFPVHLCRAEHVDMRIAAVRTWAAEVQVLPVPDARHELDAEQIGQPKDRRALSLRVGVDRVGTDLRLVLGHEIEDVMALPGPTGGEAGE